jgi:hypothetical protein
LRELDLADSSSILGQGDPDVLVGADQCWEVLTGESRRGEEGSVASYSKLGWVLSGKFAETTTSSLMITHNFAVGTKQMVEMVAKDRQLRAFWELDALRILEREKVVYEQFYNNIQ